MSDLFRDQVVKDHAAELGVPLRVTTVWMSVYTALLAVAIAAVMVMLIVGSYSRKESVEGFLMPAGGLIRVFTPQDGRVVEKRVSEGQHVEFDEVLYVIDVGAEASSGQTVDMVRESLLERKDLIEQEIVRLEIVHQADVAQLATRIEFLESQIQLMEAEVGHRQSGLRLAQDAFDRQESLLEDGIISTARLQQSELEFVLANLDLLAHQRALVEASSELMENLALQRGLADKQANEISELRRELASISQQTIELAERQTILVRSPVAGVVTRVTASVGSTVLKESNETPMLMLVPDGSKLEAHLFAPSSAVGFVQEGAEILLRYDAFAYQKFGLHRAYVSTISQTSVSTSELPFVINGDEPVYVLTAELESQSVWANSAEYRLQAGARLRADLILEERKLWEWIVGPLTGIQSRL